MLGSPRDKVTEQKRLFQWTYFCLFVSLRFSFVITGRERKLTLTRPLALHCFWTEWGSFSFFPVHCVWRKKKKKGKIKLVCIKTYSESPLLASGNRIIQEVQYPSLQAIPLSSAPSFQNALHLYIPLSLFPLSSLFSYLKSHMTAQKHPLPSLLSSLSSPCGAWHQCPSHRQMEPTLTPLLAHGEAKRFNAWLDERGGGWTECKTVREEK